MMRPTIRTGAPGVAALAWLFVLFAWSASPSGRPARAAEPAGPARAEDGFRIARGRELFARQWVPNDRRSHGGDGLGPVYNERSCLGCHHQGPSGAGGGSAGTNIEIITPTTGGSSPQGSPGFFY